MRGKKSIEREAQGYKERKPAWHASAEDTDASECAANEKSVCEPAKR